MQYTPTLVVALVEFAVSFLPGGRAPVETVTDWYALLQNNWFMGLRNLGLLNILMVVFGIPLYYSLYVVHRKNNREIAALAMIASFIGAAIFFATNRAFSMLELSRLYAQAATESQRMVIEAAGTSMLFVGQSHSLGTFLGFSIGDLAGILTGLTFLKLVRKETT